MAGRLQDKVALITGAGSGIGRASAERFAAEGAQVVVVDLKGAEETVAAIEAAGGEGLVLRTYVADEDGVAAMAEVALERFGKVDVLMNNAGILDDYLPAADTPTEVWDRVLGVNLFAQFVYTATQITGVSGVLFSVNGAPQSVLTEEPSGGSVDTPVTRANYPSFDPSAS